MKCLIKFTEFSPSLLIKRLNMRAPNWTSNISHAPIWYSWKSTLCSVIVTKHLRGALNIGPERQRVVSGHEGVFGGVGQVRYYTSVTATISNLMEAINIMKNRRVQYFMFICMFNFSKQAWETMYSFIFLLFHHLSIWTKKLINILLYLSTNFCKLIFGDIVANRESVVISTFRY